MVLLDGGDGALAEGLHGAGLLGGGLSRGAAAVAGSGGARGNGRAGLLRGDDCRRGHCGCVLVWVEVRSDGFDGGGDLGSDLED